ncbi:MAG: tRNA (guanine(46)-N(7))-methyltransferase TrmB [Alphaproteobacteria bacterium]|tara:strand:- start:34 stop:675 length:642 start_codon:yes stop_codon:yes gene_type:complete
MINNSTYRLYGRTKGRKNNKNNDAFLKIKLINIDDKNYNILDIGSGFGESTIKIAKKNKKKIVICCDKYIDGLNNIFNNAQKELLDNIYIYQGNVHKMLDEYCINNSISEVWILFPDPWPKKKHFKRRLIDKFFFNKLKTYLKHDATINIASDSQSYNSQILRTINQVKTDFLWVNQSKSEWEYDTNTLPETKYYKKALENGRKPFYVKLKKL